MTFTQLWCDLLLRRRASVVSPLPPVPPPVAMVCPACAGWGRERREHGATCLVCGGFGSVAVREAVRP